MFRFLSMLFFAIIISFTSLFAEIDSFKENDQIEIIALKGKEIIPYLNDIAHLRITIFKEWPYLYDGNVEYEKEYLQVYADSNDTIFVVTMQNNEVIGAITGLPLNESMPEIKEVFLKEGISIEKSYYLGELVLLKDFRDKKIGLKMYLEFEKLVREKQKYNKITFCEIDRENDLRKPVNYQPLNLYCDRSEYIKIPQLVAFFDYKEIDSNKEEPHPMLFWEKLL